MGDAVLLRVRLTPKASKDAVEGLEQTADGPALRAKVRAAPSEGEANSALERLIADWLGIAKGQVSIARGGKSRVKSLGISGTPDAVETLLSERLDRLVRPDPQ